MKVLPSSCISCTALALLLLLLLLPTPSLGSRVEFQWDPGASSLKNRDGNDIAAYAATVLTFLSGNDEIDFDEFAMLNDVYGDDFFVDHRRNRFPGRYSTTGIIDDQNDYVDLYAYAVVLDLPYATFVDPEGYNADFSRLPHDGSIYFGITLIDGPLLLRDINKQPPDTAQLLQEGGNVVANMPLIPEPGALAMLAMGAFVAAGLRRVRRRL